MSILASKLLEAENSKRSIEPVVKTNPALTIDEAYTIQLETIDKKVQQGHKIIGKKIGLTSEVVQQMLKVDEPDYGHLLSDMMVEPNGNLDITNLIQPKIEGEIAFVLKCNLTGPNVTVKDVLEATDYVAPALEIVDSRIADWNITLQDTVADNASSGLFVIGDQKTPIENLHLPSIQMELLQNGNVINKGTGAAALGNPAACVAWLANRLADYQISLKAGEIILSGALSGMVTVEKGDQYTAKFDHLGEVSVSFK